MAATTGESRYGDSAAGRVVRWFASTLKIMARNKVGFAGFLLVSTIILVSFLGPIFMPEDDTVRVSQIYQSPSLSHPLGTDSEGKDVLSQIIHGGWPILTIGYLAAAISTIIAVTLGSLSAFLGGRVDGSFTWLADMVLTIPQLPLLAVLAGVLSLNSRLAVAGLIGALFWPTLMRAIRAQALSLKERDYVESARALDLGTPHIVFREIAPNMAGYIAINFTLAVTASIDLEKMVIYNGETPAVTPLVLSKDVDYATHGFPIATEKSFEDQGIRIIRAPTYSGPALYFNYAKIKPVADPRVRRAIAKAIDMDENGTVSLAKSAKRSEYMTGVSDVLIKDWVSQEDLSNMDSYAYNPDAAASELEDLGFKKEGDVWVSPDGERMEYELGAPAEFADWSAAAKNLGDQLTKFGIKTTVRTVTFTQWDPRMLDGDFEMGINAWGQGQPHPVYSFEYPLLTYNVNASGGGMSFDMTQDKETYGQVDLEKLVIQSASGLNEEEQKATVTKLATVFNELLPVIPLWERYGNNPALDGERVTGWLPEGDPIYQNSPYEDSFTVIMLMDGTLKPATQ